MCQCGNMPICQWADVPMGRCAKRHPFGKMHNLQCTIKNYERTMQPDFFNFLYNLFAYNFYLCPKKINYQFDNVFKYIKIYYGIIID